MPPAYSSIIQFMNQNRREHGLTIMTEYSRDEEAVFKTLLIGYNPAETSHLRWGLIGVFWLPSPASFSSPTLTSSSSTLTSSSSTLTSSSSTMSLPSTTLALFGWMVAMLCNGWIDYRTLCKNDKFTNDVCVDFVWSHRSISRVRWLDKRLEEDTFLILLQLDRVMNKSSQFLWVRVGK